MRTFAVTLALTTVLVATAQDFSPPNSKDIHSRLWYSAPGVSTVWHEHLPIGNGRLGGMVRGGIPADMVYINEDSFWSGGPMNRVNPSAQDSLGRIRPWLLQGAIPDATFEADLGISGVPSSMRQYMPGGDFQIVFQEQTGNATDYERWLDLSDGTAGAYYNLGGTTYKREYLASNPDDVLAIHLTASEAGALSFYIKFQRPTSGQNRWAEASYAENGDTIITKLQENSIVAYFAAKVKISGGKMRQVGDQIQVSGSDEAWIYANMETTVRHENPLEVAVGKVEAAASSSYLTLRERHVSDHAGLFNRTSLSMGNSTDAQRSKDTGARRRALSDGSFDPELLSLFFQYGRYLLIASSRPGSFPPNLQGIWNSALDPAWGSKFTININLQMNYWPSEVGNLHELTEPLFDLIAKLYESGKVTAKKMYNARGWVAHHNTDIWGDTAPQDIYAASAYWPMGHVWLLQHVFEHYQYTGDKHSLKPLSIGPTMDNSLLRELFDNILKAARVLGKNDNSTLLQDIQNTKERLPPLQVSPRTGSLMEWIEDYEESEPGHRHFSPLYGLFPGSEITPQDPKIWNASIALIKRRVDSGSGNNGWSRSWLAALYARLHSGAQTQSSLSTLLSEYTYNSLLGTGPPAPFQIDGNFGGCAAIAESLLQSHNGVLNVLPARLPGSEAGAFEGLVGRGGFEVSARWSEGKVEWARVLSRVGGALNVTFGTGGVFKVANGGGSGNGTSIPSFGGGNGTIFEGLSYVAVNTTAGGVFMDTNDIVHTLPDGQTVCRDHHLALCEKCKLDFTLVNRVMAMKVDHENKRAAFLSDIQSMRDDIFKSKNAPEKHTEHHPRSKCGTGKIIPTLFTQPTPDTHPSDLFAADTTNPSAIRFVNRKNSAQGMVFVSGVCLDEGQADSRAGWGIIVDPCELVADSSPRGVNGRLEEEGPFGDKAPQTGSRAELRAVLGALHYCDWFSEGLTSMVLAIDSETVVKGATEWIKKWVKTGWKTSNRTPVKNKDLWEALLGQIETEAEKGLEVHFWRIDRTFNVGAQELAKKGAMLPAVKEYTPHNSAEL
ncbi:unnamed protein product [Periconia digitata]|uniref:RNase H type-1 domain-containing protein n=1 Tax=Periconia digitata TaxID=1303443 RepID=A0A9W4U827_9PLEO|nr:unnamed protein product [Periconia digitata]